jgi:hypothetical protein
VVLSAAFVALGLGVADPIIGLIVTAVILRITWQSFNTVRADPREPEGLPTDEDRRGERVDGHGHDHEHGHAHNH